MKISRELAEFIAREAVEQPYRQVDVMNTREFSSWLSARDVDFPWYVLFELWKNGVVHPVLVLEPALADLEPGRFAQVDIGYSIPTYLDLGVHDPRSSLDKIDFSLATTADAVLWHPFQLWLFTWLAAHLDLHLGRTAVLYESPTFGEDLKRRANDIKGRVAEFAQAEEHHDFYRVLAVMLAAEPLVHRFLTRRVRFHPGSGESFQGYFDWAASYDASSIKVAAGLSEEALEEWHRKIATRAQLDDPLERWRLLIRHADIEKRRSLKGSALRADSLYDAAEVVRRYLEVYFDRFLPEEDDVMHGPQSQEIKKLIYGRPRVADFDRRAFRRITRTFDLDPQARTTWYVEGFTEEGFIERTAEHKHVDVEQAGIEVMNLKGLGGASGDKLLALLERAQREETFPYVMIDHDRSAETARQIAYYGSVGLLPAGFKIWERDFEVANFTFEELAAVATKMAADQGVTVHISAQDIQDEMEKLRHSGGEKGAGKAVERLLERQLFYQGKGKPWGRYLADWAEDHQCPQKISPDEKRPIIGLFEYLMRGQTSNYASTVERSMVKTDGSLGDKGGDLTE